MDYDESLQRGFLELRRGIVVAACWHLSLFGDPGGVQQPDQRARRFERWARAVGHAGMLYHWQAYMTRCRRYGWATPKIVLAHRGKILHKDVLATESNGDFPWVPTSTE